LRPRRDEYRPPKITASFRLSVDLVRQVRVKAAEEGVQPWEVAERLIETGLKAEQQAATIPA
jgi:hypothetical protein